jgi:O-antigen/teichoic acid export membrane protein
MVQSVAVAGIQITCAALGPLALLGGRVLGQAAVNLRLWKGVKSTLPTQRNTVNLKSIFAMAKKYKHFPLFSSWAGLLNAGGAQVPPLCFAALFGPAAAGGYMLAQRVVNMPLSVIGGAIADAFLPSSIDALREKKLGTHVAFLFSTLVSLIFPGATLLFFIAPGIFGIMFGEDWYLAGEIVRWLSPMLAVQFLINPVSRIFVTIERQDLALLLQASLFGLRIGALLLAFLAKLSLLDAVKVFSFASVLGYGLYFVIISNIIDLDKKLFLVRISPAIFLSILISLICVGLYSFIDDDQLWLLLSSVFGGVIVTGYSLYFLKNIIAKA